MFRQVGIYSPVGQLYEPEDAGSMLYELAVIMDRGMRAMMEGQADEFYYVTVMNENYAQPSLRRARRRGSSGDSTGSVPRRRARGSRSGWSAQARSCAR